MKPGIATFIAVAVIVNILTAVWLIWWTANSGAGKSPKQTTHIWDGDLTEYNNPLPRWWLWLFIITIVFAFIYLWLYPGMGNFTGSKNWTQLSQWQAEEDAAAKRFELRFAALQGKDLTGLSHDAGAMGTARNLFALNCSTCHGSDARGAKGFPNLTDNDWLWGGSDADITQTINAGRNGVMPCWSAVLGEAGVEQLIAYVQRLSGKQVPSELADAGKAQYDTVCAACHGSDGKGNQMLGAPNLTDQVWLHGGSVKDLRESIANGRTNHMPPHLQRLGEAKVRLLTAYVKSLSRPAAHASGEQHADAR